MKYAVSMKPPKGAHEKTEIFSGRHAVDAIDQARKAHPTWAITRISRKEVA